MDEPLTTTERQEMNGALEAIRNINRLTHHIQFCRRCQGYLIDTIANDQHTTAATMWTTIQSHATQLNQCGLV
jgi:hypothetical protein